jgi:hypothetical protein
VQGCSEFEISPTGAEIGKSGYQCVAVGYTLASIASRHVGEM